MHRPQLRALLLVCGAGLWMSCSSSTSPKPTVAGTWHVAVGALSRGTLTPSTFDVVVTSTGANTFAVSMPTLTWSVGPMVFDGAATIVTFSDTTKWGFGKKATTGTACAGVAFGGTLNASKNALNTPTVTAGDTTITINSVQYCYYQTTGSFTAAK